MNAITCGYLRLQFQSNPIAAFFPLLQKGFYVETTTDNLQELLCRICGIEFKEVRDRIQTVFLNGKPVDDMETVFVEDGDCLALSAAMPGLVGATMRSGGILAGFRQSISHRRQPARSNSRSGLLSVKLFNLLIKEIGPRFLKQGILVETDGIGELMESILETDRENCIMAQWNTQMMDAQSLSQVDWPGGPGLIRLDVTFGQSSGLSSPDSILSGNSG